MQARARFIVLGLKLQLGLAPTVQLFSTSSACSLPSVAQLMAFEMECDGDDLMGMLGDDCSASVPKDENNCSASANKSTSDEQNSSVGAAPALFPFTAAAAAVRSRRCRQGAVPVLPDVVSEEGPTTEINKSQTIVIASSLNTEQHHDCTATCCETYSCSTYKAGNRTSPRRSCSARRITVPMSMQ
jgi:hypothetical protein